MLSSIGRAAAKRLFSTTATTTSLHRFAVSRFAVNELKSNHALIRSIATRSRPKSAAAKTTTKPTSTKKPTEKKTKSTKSIKSTKSTKTKAESKPAPRKRQPLTPEKEAMLEKRELKKTALFTEPKPLPVTTWTVYIQEQTKQKSTGPADLREKMTKLSQSYKDLPASEFQRLTALAEENKLTSAAAYKAWLESHTPAEMVAARKARLNLKKKYSYPSGSVKVIHDDRVPKKPSNSFSLFTKARWASGDYAHIGVTGGAKEIAKEWKNLSETERLAYNDLAKASQDQYAKDVKSVLQREVHRRPPTA